MASLYLALTRTTLKITRKTRQEDGSKVAQKRTTLKVALTTAKERVHLQFATKVGLHYRRIVPEVDQHHRNTTAAGTTAATAGGAGSIYPG